MMEDVLSTLVVNVRYSEGKAEQVIADGPRILIGSGAHCDVCLPLGAAAPEHLEVVVSAQRELIVRALASEPIATLRGSPFGRERMAAGDVLKIGSLQLEIALSDDGTSKKKGQGNAPSTRMVLALLAAMILALVSWKKSEDGSDSRKNRPPPLWSSDVAATMCPRTEPATALALGLELRAQADAKRERVRFAIHDGIVAVELLERASSCFRTGGHGEAADESAELGAQLRKRIEEDYRGHQLRLEHALTVDEVDTALHEARILRAMLPQVSDPYVAWLDEVDRALVQRLEKRNAT